MVINMSLNCVQINLKKAFTAAIELNGRVKDLQKAIIFATEPYVTKGKIRSAPPGYFIIGDTNPRAALFCSSTSGVVAMDQFTSRDVAVGLLQEGKNKIMLVSAYLDIKLAVIQEWLREIVKYAEKKK